MTRQIDATTLKTMITDGQELALLDVREDGQFGEGHMLFAVPMPYSDLEARLDRQLTRRLTRTVLVDAGDDVAERAAAQLELGAIAQARLWHRHGTLPGVSAG